MRGTIQQNRSQAACVWRAASRRWPVRLVLVWHMGMLKLLPFVRATGSRTVLFLHGVEAWRKASPLQAALLRRVDLFLTNSDFTWVKFVQCNPDFAGAPHRTVPLGLGEPTGTRSIAEPGDPPSALMIGRISRNDAYKGHDAVISAWKGVSARLPGARLNMIGPCELSAELAGMAATYGIAGAVRIAGVVTEEEKERSLSDCRCMALPSRGEGFGLAYLESMRMGRPCLASTFDAGHEVVCPESESEAAGLAVDPADTAGVTAALIRLMTPGPEWEQWSATGRRRYETNYTATHFRRRLAEALAGAV
jgi:phosphatidylinositol alpha-1,6-mannosyltransferase